MTDAVMLNPKGCAALVWRGSIWSDTPEPDEFCLELPLEDSDYCHIHQWTDEDLTWD